MHIPFKVRPFQKKIRDIYITDFEKGIYEEQINTLKDMGAISECKSTKGEFISPGKRPMENTVSF